MRQSEIDYWDKVARDRVRADGAVSDNWLKRQAMMSILCKYNWMREKVLEIGVGSGLTAGMLRIATGSMWNYIGTDLSSEFCAAAKKHWCLDVVQADVLSLPEGPFSRILALDSLEHVRPEDRPQGYDNIVSRMTEGGLMFINIPPSESAHDQDFDHGFDLGDLHELEKRGLTLSKYDTYHCQYKSWGRSYAMAVLTK